MRGGQQCLMWTGLGCELCALKENQRTGRAMKETDSGRVWRDKSGKGKKGKRPGIGYHTCESLDDEISPEARQEVAGIVVDCAVVVEGVGWGGQKR